MIEQDVQIFLSAPDSPANQDLFFNRLIDFIDEAQSSFYSMPGVEHKGADELVPHLIGVLRQLFSQYSEADRLAFLMCLDVGEQCVADDKADGGQRGYTIATLLTVGYSALDSVIEKQIHEVKSVFDVLLLELQAGIIQRLPAARRGALRDAASIEQAITDIENDQHMKKNVDCMLDVACYRTTQNMLAGLARKDVLASGKYVQFKSQYRKALSVLKQNKLSIVQKVILCIKDLLSWGSVARKTHAARGAGNYWLSAAEHARDKLSTLVGMKQAGEIQDAKRKWGPDVFNPTVSDPSEKETIFMEKLRPRS